MKKFLFSFGLVVGLFSCVSCSSSRWAWLQSNGILTYNRVTGQLEVMWENAGKAPVVVHDTVFVDTCKNTRLVKH